MSTARPRRQPPRGGHSGALQPGWREQRLGALAVMAPAERPPATAIDRCLQALQTQWREEGHLAALWQRWPALAGPQLAPHCRPLRLQGSLLTVGASPGPWLLALQYHRHQLLAALRAAGFAVRDLRVEQHHPLPLAGPAGEESRADWARHPSRVDVHGLASCPRCGSPAPAGEMARWGHCSFCRRQALAAPQLPRPQ
jgi:predicted nucleic acid-binding Zn ribbon protein